MVQKYKIFETRLSGPETGNPFRDTVLEAVFTNGTVSYTVGGFYDGKGEYVIRFMPCECGLWKAVTKSNCSELDGCEFQFEAVPAENENHGRVLLKSDVVAPGRSANPDEDRFHFSYEDGTPFRPYGTTCYAWVNQSEETQDRTVEVLKNSPFNKVRMCIFPKFYTYNTEDPVDYAFEGDAESGFDLERFNPVFWRRLEKRIAQLDEIGVQADIILLHPYDRWGFSKMGKETDIYYLSYAVRRLSHFKNVWWSLANEYDLMPDKSVEDWETYARVVMANDPYGHLRSIHNCHGFYDHSRPWITHASIQRIDVYKTSEAITEWREQYNKPIVVDECAYEGNINFGWGNITAEEMTRRFWEGAIRGGYLSHGETYVDRGPEIWWAHGGVLYGESPDRIAFLRQIMDDVPDGAKPVKVTPENNEDFWDVPCLAKGTEYALYYFGFFRPCFRTYRLPESESYEIELIDTWNMTVEKLPGTYSGEIRLEMPSRQYMAFRMKSVKK